MNLLDLHPPHGPVWQLVLAVAVVALAPIVVERVRVPGMIGLLAGGCILGPNVLGIVSDSTGIVKDLGTVGLLYLMFLAGLELDLGVFAQYRTQAVTFAMLTFAVPTVFGIGAGYLVEYDFAAALLLGSLFASYTLVVYPILRNMGLAANKAVAVAVGATVITDTLALIILAAVAGSTRGDASGVELIVQIGLGFAVLLLYCFVLLQRAARWFFRGIGRGRAMRYLFVLAAMLSSGVLAEVVGIESIVGAFFAGLALNRLVPNESEFMERIEFFGSTLLIPMFLVSVGTIIDPAVLIDPGTLALGGLFTLACVLGKVIAAAACRPLFGFSWDEVGAMFGLSVVQAAATLAATFVGLEIGLFSMATVNAVMIVIVVTMLIASTTAQRFGRRIPRPPLDSSRLGRSLVVHLDDPADAGGTLRIAGRLADSDGGVVHPVVVVADGSAGPDEHRLEALHDVVAGAGIDAEVAVSYDSSITDGIIHTASANRASLVVVPATAQSWLPTLFEASQHRLVAGCSAPTVIVRTGSAPFERTVLMLNSTQAARPTSAAMYAAHVAVRLSSGRPLLVVAAAPPSAELASIWQSSEVLLVDQTTQWWATDGRTEDLVVVPGGRNGALTTARLVKAVTSSGASVAVVADRLAVASPAGLDDHTGILPKVATRG